MADDKPELIWVKSGRDDDQVAAWEKDPAHPGGEVFVARAGEKNDPVRVARTPFIEDKLRSKDLVETTKSGSVRRVAADEEEEEAPAETAPAAATAEPREEPNVGSRSEPTGGVVVPPLTSEPQRGQPRGR